MSDMGKNIVIGILVVLVLSLGGITIYNNFIKDDEHNVSDNSNDNKENNDMNADVNNLTSSELDSLGQSLFAKTNLRYWTGSHYLLYNDELVTYADLTDYDKSVIAFNMIPAGHIDFYYENYGDIYNENGSELYSSVDYDYYVQAFKSVFGNDTEVIYENGGWQDPMVNYCALENQKINCYGSNGGDATESEAFIKYSKTELDGEDVIVYVDFLNYSYEKGIYSDLNFTDLIASDILDGNITNEEVFQKYGNDAGKFKVTFKKDSINNYYWYSSEFVE